MPTLYLVVESGQVKKRRLHESDYYDSNYDGRSTEGLDDPLKGTPVRAFLDRDRAEDLCRSLEKQFRARTEPFSYGYELSHLTDFDPGPFRDWLLDAGLPVPDLPEESDRLGDLDFWSKWWDEMGPALSAEEKDRLWQALEKLRFYHVVAFEEPIGLVEGRDPC
jgi:hypothetical protein